MRIGDSLVAGEVKPVVTAGSAQQLVREARRQRRPMIVVGDRIAEDAKATLRRAGVNFLDRRGELRLFDGPLKIDAKVPSSALASETEPLSSQVAQEVAIACLLEPGRPHGVREVAAYIARAPSAVSKAMAGLRAEGLLTSKGEAAVPDLFLELAVRWRRRPVALVDVPRPGRGSTNAQLELGLDEPEPATPRRSGASGEVWPVANHIVVALDISADKARGQEALDQWQPEGITRAW